MRVAGLFAGIGGIERGFAANGLKPVYFCEWWAPAQKVLQHRYPGVQLDSDINDVRRLPAADIVTGGFPCTDLSQAGRTAGIDGLQSGLVRKALSLIENHKSQWLVLENVRNMLPLDGGRAMASIVDELERMGFRWAYRLVDSRFTGVPQRRQRVIIIASRNHDPRAVLFADDAGERPESGLAEDAYGFYWTEGLRGLGWARDAVPTLKGGSTIGIPSPPAVWLPNETPGRRIVTPGLRTAERLQGFPVGWTSVINSEKRGDGARWKMVGNAVTVGVSSWVGRRLVTPGSWDQHESTELAPGSRWPTAAWGDRGKRYAVNISLWPTRERYKHLSALMGDDFKPLSHRAVSGFLSRLETGSLHAPSQFRLDLKEHLNLSAPDLRSE